MLHVSICSRSCRHSKGISEEAATAASHAYQHPLLWSKSSILCGAARQNRPCSVTLAPRRSALSEGSFLDAKRGRTWRRINIQRSGKGREFVLGERMPARATEVAASFIER